nr:cytochrome c heme attachment protein [Scenedesmaceae sp. YH-2023b]
MNIFEIENFFANSSFFFLFFSMIFYWIQIAFAFKNLNFGRVSMLCANFCLLSLLILRWKESGHFPLSNLYESLMFLSWSLSSFHLILENLESGENNSGNFEKFFPKTLQTNRKGKQPFFGALTSPAALFTNAFATFSLPSEMQHSSALVPALQSNWLMMHVTVMILSYSALICGSLLSIAFLILTKNMDLDYNSSELKSEFREPSPFISQGSYRNLSSTSPESFSFAANSQNSEMSEFPPGGKTNLVEQDRYNLKKGFFSSSPYGERNAFKIKIAENLDNLSYRILGIGFPFLTIGILSGAVWANEAWGSYWSWDPKETWALATWLVFAIYLHTRLTKGWRGKKPALIASVGFIVVWICFLGVNLLGEGLHSYGFFKEKIESF